MAETTKIEWCDHTFNPWIGCTEVSPACDHCYARTLAERYGWAKWGAGQPRHRTSEANWAQVKRWAARARRDGVRRSVFSASLADIMDPTVPPEWRADARQLMRDTPELDWLLLTKLPKLAPDFFDGEPWPDHVWAGTTVENQAMADLRIPLLLKVPARVRFLSVEPMLGPVDLSDRGAKGLPIYWEGTPADGPLPVFANGVKLGEKTRRGWARYSGIGVDWVICGGESGAKARPSHPDWFRQLRDQCKAAGVPFLFKQWGEWVTEDQSPEDAVLPGESRLPWCSMDRETGAAIGDQTGVYKLGKKHAGRLLDGVQHDGVPA